MEPLELCPAQMLSVCIIGVTQRNEVDELGCMPFMCFMLSQGLCIILQNKKYLGWRVGGLVGKELAVPV